MTPYLTTMLLQTTNSSMRISFTLYIQSMMFSRPAFLLLLSSAFAVAPPTNNVGQTPFSTSHITNSDVTRVPVVLSVMSRCPDALLCETVFNDVVEAPGVWDKINISLTFIGRLNETEPDYGVICMHGREECVGNIQQLCAAKYAPSQEQWWSFVQCQDAEGKVHVGEPELARRCAHAAGLDWENSGLGECIGDDGLGKTAEGIGLLKESVKRTTALGIQKSCTIRIDGENVCVHDENWKDCKGGYQPEDFVRQIEEAFDAKNGS